MDEKGFFCVINSTSFDQVNFNDNYDKSKTIYECNFDVNNCGVVANPPFTNDQLIGVFNIFQYISTAFDISLSDYTSVSKFHTTITKKIF